MRPADIELLREADLIFWTGPHMDGSLQTVLEKLSVTSLAVETELENEDSEQHSWLNPLLVEKAAKALVAEFAAKIVRRRDELDLRLMDFLENWHTLVETLQIKLSPYKSTLFLTRHNSLKSLADYFSLEAYHYVTEAPEMVASARDFSSLRDLLVTGQLRCLISEEASVPALFDKLSSDVDGAMIQSIDLLGFSEATFSDFYRHLGDALQVCLVH
jgi:zinc transport system substrate-binding protein